MGWVSFFFVRCSILVLLLILYLFGSASVLIQYIYENLNFQSPFLVTYLTNSLLTVYLPLWQLWLYLRLVKQTTTASSDDETASELSNSSKTGELFLSEMTNGDDCTLPGHQKNKEVAYTYMDVLYIALKIAPAWFIANCLYNYSLLLTSVSSSTIIRYDSRAIIAEIPLNLTSLVPVPTQQPGGVVHPGLLLVLRSGGCHRAEDSGRGDLLSRGRVRGPAGQPERPGQHAHGVGRYRGAAGRGWLRALHHLDSEDGTTDTHTPPYIAMHYITRT